MIAGIFSIAAVPAPQPLMLPGLWQITVQTRAPIAGIPISHTVCIDKAVLTHPDPPKSGPHDRCQVMSVAGPTNETAYTIQCGNGKPSSSARFTYLGDHFDGTAIVHDGNAEFQQVFTGVRLGDCDENLQPPAGTDPKKQ
jgi:hypothetical protein